ncbi:uncharacterized protein FFB14_15284 [Fusarium fujikuroi]|nr:uncharacterized protein FFB14_15284 [Fusarium fujikuroi]
MRIKVIGRDLECAQFDDIQDASQQLNDYLTRLRRPSPPMFLVSQSPKSEDPAAPKTGTKIATASTAEHLKDQKNPTTNNGFAELSKLWLCVLNQNLPHPEWWRFKLCIFLVPGLGPERLRGKRHKVEELLLHSEALTLAVPDLKDQGRTYRSQQPRGLIQNLQLPALRLLTRDKRPRPRLRRCQVLSTALLPRRQQSKIEKRYRTNLKDKMA